MADTIPPVKSPATTPAPAPSKEPVAKLTDPASVMPSGATATPKKSLPKWILAVAAAVIVLIASIVYAAVFAKSPEQQIQSAFAKSFSAESVGFSGDLTTPGGTGGAGNLSFSGQSNRTAAKFNADIDLSVTRLKIEVVIIDNEFYIKVKGLKGIAALADEEYKSLLEAIESLDDTYIVITQSTLEQFGLPTSSITTTNQPSAADVQKMADLAEDARFITVVDKLGNKDVGGQKAKGYSVRLDRDGIIAYFEALKNADMDSVKITDAQIESLRETLNNAQLDKLNIEIWLADGYIAQLVFESSEASNLGRLTISFSGYDQPVSIEKPSGAKSLLEVFSELEDQLGGYNIPAL